MSYRVRSVSARSRDCLCTSAERSCCLASASLASASICACLYSASMLATCACCVRRSFCSCTRRFSSAASADCSARRALSASCSTCGLLSSRMTESGRTSGARPKQDALDAAIGRRRQPARVFRHERAEAAHLANERPALDGVDQQRRTVDGRRGGLHPRQRHGDERPGRAARRPRSAIWRQPLRRRIAGSRATSIGAFRRGKVKAYARWRPLSKSLTTFGLAV